MPHEHGKHLGSVRTLEDVRQRCHVDKAGCWHLRSGNGKPLVRADKSHRIYVHGLGGLSATKVVWMLDRKTPIPDGHKAVRTCTSHDCVNPAHIEAMTDGDHKRWLHANGRFMVGERARSFERNCIRPAFTDEEARWILASPWSAARIAREFQVSHDTVSALRRGETYRHIERPTEPPRIDDGEGVDSHPIVQKTVAMRPNERIRKRGVAASVWEWR